MKIKKFNQFINEAEEPETRLDAKTNPLWVNEVRPKLIAMGYKSKGLEHKVVKHSIWDKLTNIGGYPELDVWLETLTGGNGVTIQYPQSAFDYSGDIYPNWVRFNLGDAVTKVITLKPSACISDEKTREVEDGITAYSKEDGWGCVRFNSNCLPTLLKIAEKAIRVPLGAAPNSIVI